VITVDWPQQLDPATATEVEALLAEATAEDTEAGFSTAVPFDATDGSSATRLQAVGRLEPERDVDTPVVAYLRIDIVGPHTGVAQFVVHPRYRSLGVATLFMEQIGTDMSRAGGWAGTGLNGIDIWAHGGHPAAGRMARRFGAVRVRAVWKLYRLLRDWNLPAADEHAVAGVQLIEMSPTDATAVLAELPALLGTAGAHTLAVHPRDAARLAGTSRHLVAVDPTGAYVGAVRFSAPEEIDEEKVGTIATVAVGPGPGRRALCTALVSRALVELAAAGARSAELYVDADSPDAVALSRVLDFEHDQSDLCYRLGAAARVTARQV
jgi:mycothiol synthase